jgi:polyisoprenoid-binding protein YceI
MKTILLSLLGAGALFAGQCHYEAKNVEIDWKAYKTPLKIGVSGTFDKVLVKAKNRDSKEAFFHSANITIDTSSINSKNSARDAKLVGSFFEVQDVKEIKAEVVQLKKDTLTVAITMNSITKDIPLKVDLEDDELEAKGYIDLADFQMLPSLKSINQACFDLHKGKTWQDVAIEIDLSLKKVCN